MGRSSVKRQKLHGMAMYMWGITRTRQAPGCLTRNAPHLVGENRFRLLLVGWGGGYSRPSAASPTCYTCCNILNPQEPYPHPWAGLYM